MALLEEDGHMTSLKKSMRALRKIHVGKAVAMVLSAGEDPKNIVLTEEGS
jgi:hypothetical protein